MDVDSRKDDNDDEEEEQPEPKFVFKLSVQPHNGETSAAVAGASASLLKLRWLQGQDSTLFESFYGWLKRKMIS